MTRPAPAAAPVGLDPAEVLTRWMSTARPDDLQPRLLRLPDGRLVSLPVGRWAGPVGAADESMLSRTRGAVLDIGCGPGRLTAALHQRGVDVLGLELLPEVPVLARRVGAPVLVADVFGPLPRAGQWATVLLADGNVGIGGNAARLLRRAARLLSADGRVLCELLPYDTAGGPVRLEGLGVTSAWFCWQLLSLQALPAAAASAGLTVTDTWECDGRTFAELVVA